MSNFLKSEAPPSYLAEDFPKNPVIFVLDPGQFGFNAREVVNELDKIRRFNRFGKIRRNNLHDSSQLPPSTGNKRDQHEKRDVAFFARSISAERFKEIRLQQTPVRKNGKSHETETLNSQVVANNFLHRHNLKALSKAERDALLDIVQNPSNKREPNHPTIPSQQRRSKNPSSARRASVVAVSTTHHTVNDDKNVVDATKEYVNNVNNQLEEEKEVVVPTPSPTPPAPRLQRPPRRVSVVPAPAASSHNAAPPASDGSPTGTTVAGAFAGNRNLNSPGGDAVAAAEAAEAETGLEDAANRLFGNTVISDDRPVSLYFALAAIPCFKFLDASLDILRKHRREVMLVSVSWKRIGRKLLVRTLRSVLGEVCDKVREITRSKDNRSETETAVSILQSAFLNFKICTLARLECLKTLLTEYIANAEAELGDADNLEFTADSILNSNALPKELNAYLRKVRNEHIQHRDATKRGDGSSAIYQTTSFRPVSEAQVLKFLLSGVPSEGRRTGDDEKHQHIGIGSFSFGRPEETPGEGSNTTDHTKKAVIFESHHSNSSSAAAADAMINHAAPPKDTAAGIHNHNKMTAATGLNDTTTDAPQVMLGTSNTSAEFLKLYTRETIDIDIAVIIESVVKCAGATGAGEDGLNSSHKIPSGRLSSSDSRESSGSVDVKNGHHHRRNHHQGSNKKRKQKSDRKPPPPDIVQTPKQLRAKCRETLLQLQIHMWKSRPKKPNISIHDLPSLAMRASAKQHQ